MSDNGDNYATDQMKSRRLATLRLLVENDGGGNESTIKVGLVRLGFRGRLVADGVIREDLRHLEAHDLVRIDLYQGVMVAELTRRGAAYLAREIDPVAGIQYPRAGV